MRAMEMLVLLGFMGLFVWLAGMWDLIPDWIREVKEKRKRKKLKQRVMKAKVTQKPWGYEQLWGCTEDYAAKFLHITAGHRLSKQYHRKKVETIVVLSGEINLHLEWTGEKEIIRMGPGNIYHIHRFLIHRMEAVTDVVVAEVSTPELDDVVRLEDDYGRQF
jgi:mannose-6-phosphate isomerase